MKTEKKLWAVCMVFVISCSLVGAVAAVTFGDAGGMFSTSTIVSVKGSLNETLSFKYTALNKGIEEKTEWLNTYSAHDPTGMSWTSNLAFGSINGTMWWDFQTKGLPAPLISPKLPAPLISPKLPVFVW